MTLVATVLKKQSIGASMGGPHFANAATARAANPNMGLAGFNLSDLAEAGRKQLDECRAMAQQLLDQARHEAEHIFQEAQEQGYQAGLVQGIAENDRRIKVAADERAANGLAILKSAVQQQQSSYEAWLQQYADTLASMVISATERIVRRQLESDQELIVRWAAEAVQSTRGASQLVVAVHPEMLADLGPALDELVASPQYPKDTVVTADPSLDRFDVVVRQAGGEIQAGLHAQLQRLTETLE